MEGGHDEKVASKKKTNSRLECKIEATFYHNGGKMAIIDTLFITKTAKKNHTLYYIAHIREYPRDKRAGISPVEVKKR